GGDVPPHAGAGEVGVGDGGDDDHHRTVVVAGGGQGLPHLAGGGCPDGVGAQALGHLDQVHTQVGTLQARRLGAGTRFRAGQVQAAVAVAELVAVLAAAAQHLQAVDDLVAVVLGDHDGDRQALLGGGDQLGG